MVSAVDEGCNMVMQVCLRGLDKIHGSTVGTAWAQKLNNVGESLLIVFENYLKWNWNNLQFCQYAMLNIIMYIPQCLNYFSLLEIEWRQTWI